MTTSPNSPMLFGALSPLSADSHQAWGLLPDDRRYPCSTRANAVPIGAAEFISASTQYPIVFTPKSVGTVPLALTAIVEGRNLFTQKNGQWLSSAYVPAWLQRWPFSLQFEANGEATVWVDAASHRLVRLADDPRAQPLFNHLGEPNQALIDVISACESGLRDMQAAQQFAHALDQHGLLQDASIEVALPDWTNYRLDGFRVVRIDALAGLSDALLAQWTRAGWIGLISLHIASLANNWSCLQQMHAEQLAQPHSADNRS